jgi:ubiquinone/menaquinone biosynthesis C-methylase UbiE
MQETHSSTKAVEYFENHAEYYEKSQYRTGRRTFINSRHDHIVTMLAALAVPETAKVLDAGCGPGNLVPEFARRYHRVYAMDASPRMVNIARSNAAGFPNVSYQVGNIEALPFADGTFDVVCSAGVIEYLPNMEKALAEMCRVLHPAGLLILSTTNSAAPAHWFRPLLEPVAQVPVVARAFGIEPGDFQLWFHRVPEFKKRLQAAALLVESERHFYFTLPRPLDRVFPTAARTLEGFFDRYMSTGLRHLAEGYIAVARKAIDGRRG